MSNVYLTFKSTLGLIDHNPSCVYWVQNKLTRILEEQNDILKIRDKKYLRSPN